MTISTLEPAVQTPPALTSEERQTGRHFLQQTRDITLGALSGVSARQWTYRPNTEDWSIGDIAEHTVFILELVCGRVRSALAEAPPPPDRDHKLVDSIAIFQFPNRLKKFKAPEFANPTGRFQNAAEASTALSDAYQSLSEYLESLPGLRLHAVESAPLKACTNGAHTMMDDYQFILAAAAHTQRHALQILELKATPNYPAN